MSISIKFIELLFPDIEKGKILVWQANGKKSSWFDDAEKAGQFSVNKTDIYIGCGLRFDELPFPKRGGEKDIIAIPGFWFDLDMAHGVHKKNNLPDLESGLKLLDEMPLKPSLIVDSGGGLQPWWLFKEPWYFDTEKERREAKSLLNRWQSLLIDSAVLNGWQLDNTAELARVLRIPGTKNGKFKEPKDVGFYNDPRNCRYDPSEFEQYLPEQQEARIFDMKTGQPQKDNNNYPEVDANILLDRCLWLKHCRNDSQTLSEPEWYTALSIVGRCKDGANKCHEISMNYPGYSVDETNKKIEQALSMSGPALCSTIERKFSGLWCVKCDYRQDVRTPMHLASIPDDLPEIIVKQNPKIDERKWTFAKNVDPEIGTIYDDNKMNIRKQARKLSYRLVSVGWSDQDIADALVSLGKKRELQPEPAKYYGRIIASSKNLFKTNTAEDMLEEEYGLDKQAKDDPEQVLEIISNIFRFKVNRFVKYLSEPPSYMLDTEMGEIPLGDDCISQVKFRRAVGHYGNKVIKSMKSDKWSEIVQKLFDVRIEEDIGPEATDKGAMDTWLNSYLKDFAPREFESYTGNSEPFIKDGHIHVCGPHFQQYIFRAFGENMHRVTVATLLRKLGLQHKVVRVGENVVKCWKLKRKS